MLACAADEPRPATKVAIFSKHLQFLQGEALARGAAEIGFDGIDITVRKGGHIEPDRVRQNLPALVKTIRAQGLEVPMISTGIVDADTPFAEDMVECQIRLLRHVPHPLRRGPGRGFHLGSAHRHAGH